MVVDKRNCDVHLFATEVKRILLIICNRTQDVIVTQQIFKRKRVAFVEKYRCDCITETETG